MSQEDIQQSRNVNIVVRSVVADMPYIKTFLFLFYFLYIFYSFYLAFNRLMLLNVA